MKSNVRPIAVIACLGINCMHAASGDAQRVIVEQVGGFNTNVWTGGPRMGIAFQGDYALLGGDSLYIVDVRWPRKPQLIGSYVLDGPVRDVAIHGHYALLAAGKAGLRVVDVSDPKSPAEVGYFPTPYETRCVDVRQDIAFVGYDGGPDQRSGAMLLINVADARKPQLISRFGDPHVVRDLEVHGDMAYVGDRDGRLLIVDVSKPSEPKLVGEVRGLGEVTAVRRADQFVHVSDNDSGYHIVDISDPAHSRRVSSVKCDGLGRLAVSGEEDTSVAKIVRRPAPGLGSDVAPDGPYAWVTGVAGRVALIDHSEKARPRVVALFDTRLRAHGVVVRNEFAFVNCDKGRLVVLQRATGKAEIDSAARHLVESIAQPSDAKTKVASLVHIAADAVPALISGMQDSRPEVREHSAHALSFIQPHDADLDAVTDVWVSAIGDPAGDATPIYYVRSAFLATEFPQASQTAIIDALVGQLRNKKKPVGDTARDTLIAVGQHDDRLRRAVIARLREAVRRDTTLRTIAEGIISEIAASDVLNLRIHSQDK